MSRGSLAMRGEIPNSKKFYLNPALKALVNMRPLCYNNKNGRK